MIPPSLMRPMRVLTTTGSGLEATETGKPLEFYLPFARFNTSVHGVVEAHDARPGVHIGERGLHHAVYASYRGLPCTRVCRRPEDRAVTARCQRDTLRLARGGK